MFIAVEMNNDGTVNDSGAVEPTKEQAWQRVNGVFHRPSTRIYNIQTGEYWTLTRPIKEVFTHHSPDKKGEVGH